MCNFLKAIYRNEIRANAPELNIDGGSGTCISLKVRRAAIHMYRRKLARKEYVSEQESK